MKPHAIAITAAIVGTVLALFIAIVANHGPNGDSSDELSELDMSAKVDSSVTAAKIEGNPQKYVGTVVQLRCTISNVPSSDVANATCGPKDDDFSIPSTANIDFTDPDAIAKYEQKEEAAFAKSAAAEREQGTLVLEGDVEKLDANQVVTILGTVLQPMDGKNGMGVEQDFPTVRIDYFVTPNSPSMIGTRVSAQRSCINRFRSKMDAMPRHNHAMTVKDIGNLFDLIFNGTQRCDINNGFAFVPFDEINQIGSGGSYPMSKTLPTPLPGEPAKTSPIAERVAYQAHCMQYDAAYFPWYIKQNPKVELPLAFVTLFASVENCDYASGLSSVGRNDLMKWLKALE